MKKHQNNLVSKLKGKYKYLNKESLFSVKGGTEKPKDIEPHGYTVLPDEEDLNSGLLLNNINA